MKVFELFSGIGGMHYALEASGVQYKLERALDINTVANAVYTFNFSETCLMENNVQSLTSELFDKLEIDMITMSPPCQPFTRVGLQKGCEDNRSDALAHLLEIIPQMTTIKYILLENVVGFESSSARDRMTDMLKKSGFRLQEFILSPNQFYIPNSRSRYYLLAKRNDLPFCFEENSQIRNKLPDIKDPDILKHVDKFNQNNNECFKIEAILEETDSYLLPHTLLEKYAEILDIVTRDSTRTCCFTKAYSHYAKGTGSVFCPFKKTDIDEAFEHLRSANNGDSSSLQGIKNLQMRYFTPKEVARLMCFPDQFNFPKDVSHRQKYRLLGNSINVHVVSLLIKLLVS